MKGENERRFAETKMNHCSSRSHCVFQITVEFTKNVATPDGKTSSVTFASTISLVDLAGSEGVAKSDIAGERLK